MVNGLEGAAFSKALYLPLANYHSLPLNLDCPIPVIHLQNDLCMIVAKSISTLYFVRFRLYSIRTHTLTNLHTYLP
jgi:hypothetical protein